MKRKILIVLSLCVVAVCSVLIFSACTNENGTAHNFGEWVIEKEPTCTETGRKYHVCTDEGCNYLEWEAVPKTAHNFSKYVDMTNDTHTKQCADCNETTTPEAHKFENYFCEQCSYEDVTTFRLKFNIDHLISCSVEAVGVCHETEIDIPESYQGLPVTKIISFVNCASLESIKIPNSVTEIKLGAFSGCTSLENISIDSKNTVYHSSGNCIIETASKNLIVGCKNSVIPTDGSVTSIDAYAFKNCTSLENIIIPDSITSIGGYAFHNCSRLTSITIPQSVTSIDECAFQGCASLENISVDSRNKVYHSSGNCIIETLSKSLIVGCKNSVIPNDGSVIYIDFCAFMNCTTLTNIIIPDSVKSISGQSFYGCTALTNITIPDSIKSIDLRTFENCTSLTSITIPNSVIHIGNWAFQGCTALININIPDSVTSIGSGAFNECVSLKSIIIPDSVTEIIKMFGELPSSLFEGCHNLTVYCEAEAKPEGWEDGWDSNCPVVWGYKGEE